MLVALMSPLGAVACRDREADGGEGSPTAVEEMSTAEPWTNILGHKPIGLAAGILERGKMIVASGANYPPPSLFDEATGQPIGFDVDVARKVGEILDVPVEFATPTWEIIPAGLDTGRWDVSIDSMKITPERQQSLDFTAPYYYTSGQLFVKQGGPQITGPEDLDDRTVGVAAASVYCDYLKESTDAKVRMYVSVREAFADLLDGNVDFVMSDGATGQKAILAGKEMEFSGSPLYYEDRAFAIKQGEADWLALLDYAVKQMHDDGSLTAMSEEWHNGIDLTVRE